MARKGGNCEANALEFEAARRRASRLQLFWPSLYCTCIQFQLPIKIITSPLNSATAIS